MSQRNLLLITIIALVVIGVAFPTLHTRTVEELVKTLDCNRTLGDGESLSQEWTNMQGKLKIVISISSTEEVQVLISATDPGTFSYTSESQKTHEYQEISSHSTWNVTVWNPTWSGNGSSAEMSGSIDAYLIETQEWLPWWMP